ncbi:hypothetical protein KP509_34G074600 [Ceratopteris richardii]|uniref:Uncharacterized protein n=1 Tax=Ceratopteris richardii TaxID=49495 RepID=A0A8T2QNI2_CERRI|nr:hypothetical protein KP509_34G074600 [Ceratopteris richardii]
MDNSKETPCCFTGTSFLHEKSHHTPSKFRAMSFSPLAHNKQPVDAWFDVKVFYIRISSCILQQAPDMLSIVYPKRDVRTELEINGGRISPSERVCFALRMDRVDWSSSEVTYVNTNNLRTTGDLSFQIYHKDELLLVGVLARTSPHKESQQAGEEHGSIPTSSLSSETGWSMDCSCTITCNCSFVRDKSDLCTGSAVMEVYVAGRSSGLPIVLTKTVSLSPTRNSPRRCSLDAIPEEEEVPCSELRAFKIVEGEYSDLAYRSEVLGVPKCSYFSEFDEDSEGGDRELSWFNAGVRVGLGLGLGVCLSVGIGVGLLMRTYHAPAKTFQKRLF